MVSKARRVNFIRNVPLVEKSLPDFRATQAERREEVEAEDELRAASDEQRAGALAG